MIRRFAVATLLALPAMGLADSFAITGARVHTVGPQGTLDDATVVVEDGRIVAVGRDVDVPAGARQIDGSGKIVTPGLFSAIGNLGVTEVNAVDGTVDYVQRGDDFTASFDVADAYNPRSTLIPINRIEGVTRAAILPASSGRPDELGNTSNVISGLGAVVRLAGIDAVTRRRAVLVVNLGESGGRLAGGSRAAALLSLRNAFDDAIDYAAHRDDYASGNRRDYSLSLPDLEALADVFDRRVPLLAYADRASDIRVLLALAGDYELPLIVAGGAEAWLLADELAAANAGVVLSSVNNLPGSFDELNARLDAPVLLETAGVRVSFGMNRNMQDHNARNITQAAGIAVANGMTWEAGLRSITLTPAELFGVAATTGSIAAGKDADLVLWPDDPLELTSYPEQVWIRGEAVPMQSRQTLLRDRYLDAGSAVPPAYRR